MEDDLQKQAIGSVLIQEIRIKTNNVFREVIEEEDSEDEMLLQLVAIQENEYSRRNTRTKPPTLTGFVEKIVPMYSYDEFQQHFRMSSETATTLENMISRLIERQANEGRCTIAPRKQILSVLWLLATPDSYRSIGQQFGMSKSTLHHCFRRVVKALNKIAPEIIHWPTLTEKEEIKQKFTQMSNMPDVIGAIDGCQIEIDAPVVILH
ncbi:hypothetical protein ACJJTC_018265 [Scirpophaga incertulas]